MSLSDLDDARANETLGSLAALGGVANVDTDEALPKQIGRFAVLGKLGEGSMGVVFLGRDAELERKIAIKLIRANAIAIAGVRRLVREAQGLARLSHPNVIQVHEIGEHRGSMFVAMEYVEGATLRDWMDPNRRSWRETLDILRQAGRGLEAAHIAGLVHRDFKPANIMVGIDGRARVLDFGLARDCRVIDGVGLDTLRSLDKLDDDYGHGSSDDLDGPSDEELGDTYADCGGALDSSLTRSGAMVGTPAYMAPEQMWGSRGDPLSDQFSFCVSAHEALVGRRPFDGTTLTQLSDNIARGLTAPISAGNPGSGVPERVQQILVRGLASDPAQRWPSMTALLDELDAVVSIAEIHDYLARIRESGASELFEPRGRARPATFRVSERLVGREAQLEALQAAFERARGVGTRAQLLLVGGLAGIGKSSLVSGLKPHVEARAGLMISGSFDQRRATPLAGINQALTDLVAQVDRRGPAAQTKLRQRLVAAAGRNGQLLIDLAPELVRLLGRQPPVPDLPGPERLNRLHLVVERFMAALAGPKRPLVVFMDDLQWADPASLALLEHLLSSPALGAVLVVGACRTNELGPEHPLRHAVERLRVAGADVSSVEVEALSITDVEALLVATLGGEPATVHELAALALNKTEGNPFHLRQLLRTMYDEGLFHYDDEAQRWRWEFERIVRCAAFGDLGDVLLRNLETLPPVALELMQIAAYVGPRVDLLVLAAVADLDPVDVFSYLWPTFEQGLLVLGGDLLDNFALIESTAQAHSPVEVVVSFRHARIQQAAAASLDEHERAQMHLKIGRVLRRRMESEDPGPGAFELVNHLNTARALLDELERSELVELNIRCGRKALTSAAYASAIDYLVVAAELLAPHAATTEHARWFQVEIARGRALSLDGRYAAAAACYAHASTHAESVAERLLVNTAQVEHALLVADFEQGYAACQRAFALYGIALPKHDGDAEAMLAAESAALEEELHTRPVSSLFELPEFGDEGVRPMLGLLHGLGAISYFSGRRNTYAWATARMTNIFVRSGNSKLSSVAYARMALHLAERGEYERARGFGELVGALCERYDDPSAAGRALIVYLGHAAYYNYPLREILPKFQAAFAKSLEGGDLLYAGHHLLFPQHFRLVAGVPLPEVLAEIQGHLPFLQRSVPRLLSTFYVPHIAYLCCTLMDIPLASLGLSFDHESHIEKLGGSTFAMGWYYPALTKLEYLLGQRQDPAELTRRVDMFETCLPGNLQVREIRYYAMLSLLDSQGAAAQPLIAGWRADLARCADRCPANFEHMHLLVGAELEHACGGPLERAIELYEQAIEHARQQQALDQEALACLRFANFWRARGSTRTAKAYVEDARELYQTWGAARLVREIDERYPKWVR
ncbi:Serine/threonine kinase PKN8 [Enhygromyxa salina]|uniref:Serine/threonine kinase PKN8 n=1 Tax=Enhygromyxa salina TaxID=215803 RepID=A0A0C2DCE2_9BACT|nr:serine/threonine-protein kinase [Enhygromyxa salina]KIG19110.1 Serine/threonine kinase PKN8 [Enhygromyxa salina]